MSNPLQKWVEEQAKLTKPDKIFWCDGSVEEARKLIEIGRTQETIAGHPVFYELNQRTRPNSYLHRSHPDDVARTEHLTYVCHPEKETTGPNNNWMEPAKAKEMLTGLSDGCMRGRTMYVLPYIMGHPESSYSRACVQITDSCYVAVNMRIMARMGKVALDRIGNTDNFVKGIHSLGDLNPARRCIMHFPLENIVWSIGSGYGGNALLGKKCISLRIASWLGLNQGWLAEHMIIIGVQDPKGKITYMAAAMPSACGKTNLVMLESTLPGYKIWTLGDDIAWLNVGPDGRLWAINPEAGFFGVAPGTSMATNPNMMRTLTAGTFYPTIYTNTALNTDTNEPWWEGIDTGGTSPKHILDWRGEPWDRTSNKPAAHPNSRFTVAISQCPTLSSEFENQKGVPISAIIFGTRRTKLMPLVYQSFNWQHGTFMASGMASETTAAAAHSVGMLRRDPMAMLPFCGYNMGDYFRHWLNIGRKMQEPPKIFFVNWFRKDESDKFMWPGFGENVRVLKWIIERVENNLSASPKGRALKDESASPPERFASRETPIGFVPEVSSLDLTGLKVSQDNLGKLFEVSSGEWQNEIEDMERFFSQFGQRLPEEMRTELDNLRQRLSASEVSIGSRKL